MWEDEAQENHPYFILGGNIYFVAGMLMLEDGNDRILEDHFVGWVNG